MYSIALRDQKTQKTIDIDQHDQSINPVLLNITKCSEKMHSFITINVFN